MAITEMYLSVNRDELEELIKASDWTHRSKRHEKAPILVVTTKPIVTKPLAVTETAQVLATVTLPPAVSSTKQNPATTLCLPGFESFAA